MYFPKTILEITERQDTVSDPTDIILNALLLTNMLHLSENLNAFKNAIGYTLVIL